MRPDGVHVVLGASGGIGNAVTRALVERGHRVRAVNRAGDADVSEPAERVAADVTQIDEIRRVLDGASVVYHAAQPSYTKWLEQFPAMNRAIIDATTEAGAKLVYADNLYMYGPVHGPLMESSEQHPTSRKGRLRQRLTAELVDAYEAGGLRVAIARNGDYFGPRAMDSAIGERLFTAALKGKRVPWLGRLDVPHSVSYSLDIGRAMAVLGERDGADGRIWHLPSDRVVTGREFIAMVAQALGTELRPTVTSPAMVRLGGIFVPMIRELSEMMYQWTEPFVSDASSFERAFGPFEITPTGDAVRETVRWYRQRGSR